MFRLVDIDELRNGSIYRQIDCRLADIPKDYHAVENLGFPSSETTFYSKE